MANPTCETCRHFVSPTPGWPVGECHRNAPHPVMLTLLTAGGRGLNTNELKVIWPETGAIQFCGEHQPRPEGPSE